ncbi:MAG TPA: hypothetical protein VEF04_12960 [Blastocatellia bacterium]|nr:hypothetical protein [Blastocatellia bacterium]
MSEKPRHTEGPWLVIHKGDQSIITKAGFQHSEEIAHVDTWGDAGRRADAQAMAATLELLDALKLALLKSGCDGDLCGDEWHEMARKAIAKAEEEPYVHVYQSNESQGPAARSISDLVTPRQVAMIRGLCRELGVSDYDQCTSYFETDIKVEELSRRAASEFIDHLKKRAGAL